MAGRSKDNREPLPDSFIGLSNDMTAIKEEYDEFIVAYREAVKRLVNSGYSIAQIAEISPFTYPTLRNWYLKEEVA